MELSLRHYKVLVKICLIATVLFRLELAKSETITLKNGSTIKGSIVEMSETEITVDTSDIGIIKIKRRTVQSISDSPQGETSPQNSQGGVNININNNQISDQKLENKNEVSQSQSQTQVQKSSESNTDNAPKTWMHGLYGRLLILGTSNTNLDGGSSSLPEAYRKYPAGGGHISWDLVGFRSESWWSVSLLVVGDLARNVGQFDGSWSLLGPNVEFNFYRKSLGANALSQFTLGLTGGTLTFDVSNKDNEKLAVFKGSGIGIRLGYDYLFNDYFGISASAGYYRGTVKSSEITEKGKSEDFPKLISNDVKEAQIVSISAVCGLFYNFNL